MSQTKTVVATNEVYNGRTLSVVVHDISLPNNVHSHQEVLQHPGAVTIVALDNLLNVFMVRQFRVPAGRTLWELPAGTLEKGENPEECACRESQEEIGYRPGDLEYLGGFYSAPGYNTEFIHLFLATNLFPSKLNADDDEFIEVCSVPFASAIEMIENGDIVDAKTIAGLLRVARRLKI